MNIFHFVNQTELDEIKSEATFKSSVSLSDSESKLFDALDLGTVQGRRAAAERLLQAAVEKGINVPSNEQEAKVRFGSIVVNNSASSPNEMLAIAEEMFGTKASLILKSEGSKTGTVCEENAG